MSVSILIVSDEPANIEYLEKSISKTGVKFIIAQSGIDAIGIAAKNPDLSLSVIQKNIKDMDSFKVAARIRACQQYKYIPIFLLVEKEIENIDEICQAYDSGIVELITVGSDPRILNSKINIFTELYLRKREYQSVAGDLKNTLVGLEESNMRLRQEIKNSKIAEEDANETSKVLSDILSAAPIGIGMIENRVIRWANDALMDIFGLAGHKDCFGKNTRIFYADESEYQRIGEYLYANSKEAKPVQVEAQFIKKDGTRFTGNVLFRCSDDVNPMNKAMITVTDITWMKNAENEKVEKKKLEAVIEMAGAVCHELNQPVMALSGYLDLLKLSAKVEETRMGKLLNQVERITEITRKLMQITRYETRDYINGIKIIDIDKASGFIQNEESRKVNY